MVIDGLVSRLEASGLGCYFQGIFAGCVLYADDVMLMSASLRKLQLMPNICFRFANELCLTFNAKKFNCLLIGKKFGFNLPILYIGNESINWANECCYLGVVIVAGKVFTTNIEIRRRKFCGAANDILSFRSILSEECIMHVVNAQALFILAYGAALWKTNYETKRRIGVCFNDCIRKIFGYNRFESVRQILYGFNMLSMDLFIVKVRMLLICSAINSDRLLVKKCGDYSRDKGEFLQWLLDYNVEYSLFKQDVLKAFQLYIKLNV